MKKILTNLFFVIICFFSLICLTGCASNINLDNSVEEDEFSQIEVNLKEYNIGDEILLGNISFNIYKIDYSKNEVYLFAENNIATTKFSDKERYYTEWHNYEGSLVENYITLFVNDLEDKGYIIKSSGIIDKDDLYRLNFKDSENLSGLPYKADESYEFVKNEKNYWVGGYCKYETRSWAYVDGMLDTESCDKEYGVRPIIVIDAKELKRIPKELNSKLNNSI